MAEGEAIVIREAPLGAPLAAWMVSLVERTVGG